MHRRLYILLIHEYFRDELRFDTQATCLQFTELSGRRSVLERPLSDAKRPLIFN